MSTDDLAPQPQARAPRSRLTWIWPLITHVLLLSTIGFWISAFMAIFHEPHLQSIGSGWWQYGAMAVAWLLYALMGLSVKLTALVTKRVPRVVWLPATKLLTFNLEAGGFALFLGYGILPLFIHPSNPLWTLGFLASGLCVVAIGTLITMIKPVRRKLMDILGSPERGGQLLVSQPVYLSRRTFLSGSVTLGMGAAGFVTFWRASPALIPDYTFFGHVGTVRSLSWFPDSERIASTDDKGAVLVWNAGYGSNLRAVARFHWGLDLIRVSPDGVFIAASDRSTLYIWDVATGALLWTTAIDFAARPFSWAPDSVQVALVRRTHGIGVVDVHVRAGVKTVFAMPERSYPNTVAWSPDGKLIAASDQSSVIMWDASAGIQEDTRIAPPIDAADLAWSPDGHALAAVFGRVVYVWSLANGAPPTAYREHSDNVSAISWSPDGRYITSCGTEEETVHVWEAATGKTVFIYNGHFSFVQAVAWSPDGQRIASGGYDKLVHVWRPVLPA